MRSTEQQGTSGLWGVRDRPADKMAVFGDGVFRFATRLRVQLRHPSYFGQRSEETTVGTGRAGIGGP
jgi:hypothetical protein